MKSEYFTLTNGLRAAVAQKKNLPITVFYVIVESGSYADPAGLSGAASLTADLLDKGAGGLSTFQLAQTLDSLGAHLSTSSSAFTSSVSMQLLSKDFDKGLDLFAQTILQPEFPEEELERAKAITLSEIEQDKQEPHALIGDLFREALYRAHPLHTPVEGYPETIPGIHRDHLVAFHRAHFLPKNAILVAVSDLPIAEVRHALEAVFGGWNGGARPSHAIAPLPPVGSPSAVILQMPLTQSLVALGHFGLRRKDPDFNAVRVMNYLLGGGSFSSRLFMGVRNRKGYAYSVHSSISAGRDIPGQFCVSFETQTGRTLPALSESLKIIRATRQGGFKVNELKDAKAFFEGSLPRRTQTYGQIASLLADSIYHGLGEDFWLKDLKEILALSADDLNGAIRRRVSVERFVLAVVGNAEPLAGKLPGVPEAAVRVISDIRELRAAPVAA
ncbi:MAG: M16 family metallopeptidase [bacterium]